MESNELRQRVLGVHGLLLLKPAENMVPGDLSAVLKATKVMIEGKDIHLPLVLLKHLQASGNGTDDIPLNAGLVVPVLIQPETLTLWVRLREPSHIVKEDVQGTLIRGRFRLPL